MKKKIVSLTMAAAMTLSCAPALLAGCGGGGGGGNSDYEHTIVFYSSQGDNLQKKTAIAIANFEAKFPGWTVVHETPGNYDNVKEKIVQDFGGDLQPDLAYCYPDHVAQYFSTEKVLRFNDFFNSTEEIEGVNPDNAEETVSYKVGYSKDELDDFIKSYWDEGLATSFAGYEEYFDKDDVLTLPFVRSTELLYYNEDGLKELNLTVPTTWEQLWAQGPALKAKYPKATLLGYDSEANWFINMCKQNNWGYTSINPAQHYLWNTNNDGLKEWLNSLRQYYKDGLLITQNTYGSYTSNLFKKGLKDGGILYCIGSSGGASYQQPDNDLFTAKVAPIPGSTVNSVVNASVISQGPSLCMLKAGRGVSNADEKAKMTFLFVKELLDPTFQAEFSITAGYNPSRTSVYENAVYKKHLAGGTLVAQACLAAKEVGEKGNFFTSPAFENSATARGMVGSALEYIIKGQRSVDYALQAAYEGSGGK